MLEVIESKTGLPSLKFADKLLSSKVDPEKEATRWAEKNLFEFSGIKTAFIIGLGAAYHLFELKRRAPYLQIVAIEESLEIIQYHEQSLDIARNGIDLVHANKMLFENEAIKKGLLSSYKVVVHPSANISFRQNPLQLKDKLNARTTEALKFVSGLRGLEVVDCKGGQLLSIKDVSIKAKTEERTELLNATDLIIKELIK